MKNRISIAIVIYIFAYLLGSFVQLSFNIADWSEGARLMACILGTLFALAFATFPFYDKM